MEVSTEHELLSDDEVIKWWNAKYPTDQIGQWDKARIATARMEMLKQIAVKMGKWNDDNSI